MWTTALAMTCLSFAESTVSKGSPRESVKGGLLIGAMSRRLRAILGGRPTAKLNASFKPRFANGLTLVPTRARINDLLSYSTGSIATIGIGHMVTCKPTRLSVAAVYPRIIC